MANSPGSLDELERYKARMRRYRRIQLIADSSVLFMALAAAILVAYLLFR